MSFASNIHFAPLLLLPPQLQNGATFWSVNFSTKNFIKNDNPQTAAATVFLEPEKLLSKEWRQAELQIRHSGFNTQGRDREELLAQLKSQTQLPADTLDHFMGLCTRKEEPFFTQLPGNYLKPLKGQKHEKAAAAYIADSKKGLNDALSAIPGIWKQIYEKENTQFCIFPAMQEIGHIVCFEKHSKAILVSAQHVPKNERFDAAYRKKFRLTLCEEAIHVADDALGFSSNPEIRARLQAYMETIIHQQTAIERLYKTLCIRNIVLEDTDRDRIYIMKPDELLAHMVLLKQDLTEEITASNTRKGWIRTRAADPATVEAAVTERLQKCLTPDMLKMLHEFESAVKARYAATGVATAQAAGS